MIRTKANYLILVLILIYCGCSANNAGVTPENIANLPYSKELQRGANWTWDVGLYQVSDDHSAIEKLPWRESDYHINVNRFIEPPSCNNCLKIWNLKHQPDGTLKIDVTLRHPFPNSPEYTGFDVRGTVIFPATRYWKREPMDICTGDQVAIFQSYFVPLYFSRAEDGGAQVLNADGYSLYFFPGFSIPGFDLPIFKYNKGKYALGPDPDSTVNAYKVFTKDTERRMFLVNDVITRTYHIHPPEGSFIFGYVVDACWAQPTKKPVTNPATDFPFWANCEDGYVLGFEQVNPFKTGTYGNPDFPPYPPLCDRHVTSATIQLGHVNNAAGCPTIVETWLIAPDLTDDSYLKTHGVAYSQSKEVIDKDAHIYKNYQGIYKGTYNASPGHYLALLFVHPNLKQAGWDEEDNYWPIQILMPAFFDFITLEVVAGDG